MPPKKAGGKKGGKKKKGPDENALFNDFLDEMFFLSKVEKQATNERRRLKIREVFALFQERGKEVIDARELGIVVRELGLNPSQQQLASIQTLVEDPENPNFIPYARLEKTLLQILETKELKTEELTPEGAPLTRAQLMFTEPEGSIQEAFDVLWDALGRKVDHDKQRYLDADALRELLMNNNNNNNASGGGGGANNNSSSGVQQQQQQALLAETLEAFSEDDVQHFLAAAQDVGTTTINEELFMALLME